MNGASSSQCVNLLPSFSHNFLTILLDRPVPGNSTHPTYALASDVELLKRQVHELYRIIGQRGVTQSEYNNSPQHSIQTAPETTSEANVEDAVATLENLAGRGADQVPRWPARPPLIPSKNVSRQSTSRIPSLLDPDSRSVTLHDMIFQILPEKSTACTLAEAYLQGPHHSGWHVSLILCGLISFLSTLRFFILPHFVLNLRNSFHSNQKHNEWNQILLGLRFSYS